MRIYFDTTCPRCGWTESATGVDRDTARAIAATHVCADGGRAEVSGEPTERRVPGPGERLGDDEPMQFLWRNL